MKEEINSIEHKRESSRLNVTLMATLNVTRLDLLLRDLLRKMTLIMRRFHQSHERIHSGLSWHW